MDTDPPTPPSIRKIKGKLTSELDPSLHIPPPPSTFMIGLGSSITTIESSAKLSIEQLLEHWLRWAIGLLTGFALA